MILCGKKIRITVGIYKTLVILNIRKLSLNHTLVIKITNFVQIVFRNTCFLYKNKHTVGVCMNVDPI